MYRDYWSIDLEEGSNLEFSTYLHLAKAYGKFTRTRNESFRDVDKWGTVRASVVYIYIYIYRSIYVFLIYVQPSVTILPSTARLNSTRIWSNRFSFVQYRVRIFPHDFLDPTAIFLLFQKNCSKIKMREFCRILIESNRAKFAGAKS